MDKSLTSVCVTGPHRRNQIECILYTTFTIVFHLIFFAAAKKAAEDARTFVNVVISRGILEFCVIMSIVQFVFVIHNIKERLSLVRYAAWKIEKFYYYKS